MVILTSNHKINSLPVLFSILAKRQRQLYFSFQKKLELVSNKSKKVAEVENEKETYGSPLKLNCLGLQWRQRLKGITDRCPTCTVLDEGVRAKFFFFF